MIRTRAILLGWFIVALAFPQRAWAVTTTEGTDGTHGTHGTPSIDKDTSKVFCSQSARGPVVTLPGGSIATLNACSTSTFVSTDICSNIPNGIPCLDSSAKIDTSVLPEGTPQGGGTANYHAMWLDSATLTDSTLMESGNALLRQYGGNQYLSLETYNSSTSQYPQLRLRHSLNGTIGNMTTTTNGSLLGLVLFQGVSSAPGWGGGAGIEVDQLGTAGSTFIPSKMILYTYSSSGANTNQFVLNPDNSAAFSGPVSASNISQTPTASYILKADTDHHIALGWLPCTTTPTAGGCPLADGTGHLDPGWIPSITASGTGTATGTGSANFIPKWVTFTSTSTATSTATYTVTITAIGNSIAYDNGSLGINKTNPATTLDVGGDVSANNITATPGSAKIVKSRTTPATIDPAWLPGDRTINGYGLDNDIVLTPADVSAVPTSAVGAPGGVCPLEENTMISTSYIPDLSSTYVSWSAVEGTGTATSTSTSKVVQAGDSRLSDARKPLGSEHAVGCVATYHTGTGTGTATDTATGTSWTLVGDPTFTCTSTDTSTGQTFSASNPRVITDANNGRITGSHAMGSGDVITAIGYTPEFSGAATTAVNAAVNGTSNVVPKFTSAHVVGNSQISDNGTTMTCGTATNAVTKMTGGTSYVSCGQLSDATTWGGCSINASGVSSSNFVLGYHATAGAVVNSPNGNVLFNIGNTNYASVSTAGIAATNITATPTASAIPKADSGGHLNSWIAGVPGNVAAYLSGGTLGSGPSFSSSPAANIIPVADGSGTLNAWVTIDHVMGIDSHYASSSAAANPGACAPVITNSVTTTTTGGLLYIVGSITGASNITTGFGACFVQVDIDGTIPVWGIGAFTTAFNTLSYSYPASSSLNGFYAPSNGSHTITLSICAPSGSYQCFVNPYGGLAGHSGSLTTTRWGH